MMNQSQVNQLCEDNELAFFRADVCLSSPQSFTLEEKAIICEDMDATNKAIVSLVVAFLIVWLANNIKKEAGL